MSKFKKVLKKEAVENAFHNHPVKNLESEVQEDYVKGLLFIAVEDETFDDEEKKYITSLMNNLGVDESKLSEFEAFAKDPDEDELIAFMDRLRAFEEDTRINFLIEAVVLAFKDGEFDESEQEMFDDYLEMLELTDKKELILHMAKALVDKNIDLALALYTADKEFFEKFDYLFDIADIDIEKELKDLYSWDWVKFKLTDGEVEDNNLVAAKPVTTRQFCVFLNFALLSGNLKQFADTKQYDYGDNVVIKNIDNINLDFDKLFNYREDESNSDIVGIESVDSFIDFVNNKTDNDTQLLKIIASSYVITLDEVTKELLTDNLEKFIAFINYDNQGNKMRYIDINGSYYQDNWHELENNVNYTFRLMKIELQQ